MFAKATATATTAARMIKLLDFNFPLLQSYITFKPNLLIMVERYRTIALSAEILYFGIYLTQTSHPIFH